ncbi:hypothetical protein QZH41_018554 [Actinostola sp. cb2023]|nr:hypothetical protein QZH41_018554 [Actinostola sp. cb2023]
MMMMNYTSRATKQLKQTTADQLEHETKRMEGRIRALKEQMVKEKEEREKCGGSRWMSGKIGPLLSQTQQVPKKKPIKAEKGPRKLKLLSDEPLSSYAPSKKTALRESLNESFGTDMICGQCEKTKATLSCVECTENYCVGCFMGFHRKGALRSHTTKNLDQVSGSWDRLAGRKGQDNQPITSKSKNGASPELKPGGSLLQGSYDEKESLQSFAQALNEWRNTKGKENSWTNPADKVSTVSCETSTLPEKVQPVEINLNFGSNKSLSYLDRIVLKKHRDLDPVIPSIRTPSRERNKTRETKKLGHSSIEKTNDDFGVNYREIFQSIGVQSARAKSSPSQSYYGRSSVTIEEMRGPVYNNTEETTTCIIEEGSSNTPPAVNDERAVPSRGGRVSILTFTANGDFREDPLQPSTNCGIRSSQSRQSPLIRAKQVSPPVPSRVWSPKPTYTGLSEFFLAGVKAPSPSNSPKMEVGGADAKAVSSKLITKGVWKPDDSVCIIEVTNVGEEPGNESSIPGPSFPVIPLVQEPVDDVDHQTHSSKTANSSMEKGNSLELEVGNMQDFGINDFLKAGPVPRKLSGDYNVHRVSTVSPLTLSPKPPQLHWSDDDSDDEVIVDVASRVPETEQQPEAEQEPEAVQDFHGKDEQDQDDRATLENLSWELASTTGRLTHCEGDLDDSPRDVDTEQDDMNNHSGDEDSIEEDNGGTSLDDDSGDDNVDADEISLQDSLMKEEVYALK